LHPVPDIDHTDHLLIFGSNPRVSHRSFLSITDPIQALRSCCERGATVRFVNPYRIEPEAAGVGEVVLIRPDTDVYLMAAMLSEMDRAGAFREDELQAQGRNHAELREFVARYPADRVAGVTGIPAERIRTLALEFAQAPSAAVYMSTGVNMGRQETLAYWRLFMLSLVTGNLDRRGGTLYALGFYPAAKAGRIRPKLAFEDTPRGPVRRTRAALPGNLLADMILQEEDPIRALVVTAGNPLLSIGGEGRMRQAFEKLELHVVVDLFRNATGEFAHYVLPCADMLERRDVNLCGLGLQHEPFVQYTEAVVPPRDERREEWWIFARLEQALGFRSVLDAGEDPPLFSRLDYMLSSVGLSIGELSEREGGTVRLPPAEPGRFFDDCIQTEDRRVDCCPEIVRSSGALDRVEVIFEELCAEPAGQLKLITRRELRTHNSWYQNVERFRKGAPTAAIPSTSTLKMPAFAGSGRVISFAYPARRHPGLNPDRLLPTGPGSFEPLSNQAFMTGVASAGRESLAASACQKALALAALALQEVVDEPLRDAHPPRKEVRHRVCLEPASVLDFFVVDPNLACVIGSGKAQHQRVGVRPWLATEVADVLDSNARLFHDFSGDRLFGALSGLDEACKNAVDPRREVR
jgi:hypothetical protein